MRIVLWFIAIGAVVAGAGIIVTSLPDSPWGQVDPSPLSGGVALGAVGLTGGIALATSATFAQQRRQATEAMLREQRAGVYHELLAGMLRSFGGALPDVTRERATVALWASPSSLRAFEAWFTFASSNIGDVPASKKPELYGLIGECVAQMRVDLGIDSSRQPVDKDLALQMIFVNYRSDIETAKRLLS